MLPVEPGVGPGTLLGVLFHGRIPGEGIGDIYGLRISGPGTNLVCRPGSFVGVFSGLLAGAQETMSNAAKTVKAKLKTKPRLILIQSPPCH